MEWFHSFIFHCGGREYLCENADVEVKYSSTRNSPNVDPYKFVLHYHVPLPVQCRQTASHNIGIFSILKFIVQELCASRGGRTGLSILTSLMVSMDVKQ